MTDTAMLHAAGDKAAASSPARAARLFAVPPRPPRDTRLDLARGWLQLTIFASHATGSWIGAWLIFAPWGLSDSSQQFVFLSGFTLGSVFSRKAARDGWLAAAQDVLWRTWRLDRTHLIVVALFGLTIVLADAALFPGEAERQGWTPLLHDPLRRVPLALATLEQPNFMSILPVFIWCMLLLPGFAAAEARWGDRALLFPFGLYAATWAALFALPATGFADMVGFNAFGWQVLFLAGAWLGRRALLYGQALAVPPRWGRWLTAGAVLVLLGGLALRLGWNGMVPALHVPHVAWLDDKKNLGPGQVLHAMALAWLVARHVPRERAWMHRPAVRWLSAVGRHSLTVFCVGLFLSWGASAIFRLAPPVILLDPVLIGAGCTLLGVFAWWRDQRREAARLPATA